MNVVLDLLVAVAQDFKVEEAVAEVTEVVEVVEAVADLVII